MFIGHSFFKKLIGDVMKIIVSLLLVFAVLFGFSACGDDTPDSPVSPDGTTANNISTDKTDNKKEDAYTPFDLYCGSYCQSEWDDVNYVTLATVDVATLVLSDEAVDKYPYLSNTVEQHNADTKEYADEEFDSLVELAEDDVAYNGTEYFGGYTYTSEYYVQRADNAVLSVRYDWDTFSGGMHPDYGTNGLNFDPATGKVLTLSDVVTDVPGLISLVKEKLNAEYTSATFFDSLDATLSEYSEADFAWTINYQSITFYFSPYQIAPYAAGLITATVYFDEQPELFKAEYTKAQQAYAYAVPMWSDVDFDLDEKDGKADTLSYGMYKNEEGYADKIQIKINGKEFTFADLEAFSGKAYLAFADGKNYLYFEAYGNNDYEQLMIFEVEKSSVNLKETLTNSGFGYIYIYGDDGVSTADKVFNNPYSFILDSRMDFLGTYRGLKSYSIDSKTGLPVTQDKAYIVEMNDDFVLTCKTELSVEMLSDKKEKVMPSGTNFRIIRTDDETYVDTVLEDGRECRIYAEFDKNEYQLYIDGMPENDVFEEIMYAG